MKDRYDIIVVGAGPAGATIAYEMAERGFEVLLIEKEMLPRYKCCAGGITVRAARLLGFNISHLVENTVTGARIDFNGQANFTGTWKDALVYTVNRDMFDYELVKRAQRCGVTLLQGVSVTDVRNLSAAVEVVTSAGVFKSSFLAGADGAHSIVARKSGIKRQHDHIIGINNEIEISAVDLNAWRSCIRADIGCIRGGYGWVFPKRDHLSIGIASLARINACGLRQAYDLYEKSLCLISHNLRKRSGHIIPVIKRDQILFADRIVLTGDAAGLADPLTGEGIYSAVLSGQLASAAFEAALHYGKEKLAQYQSAVAGTIFPELKIARVLRSLFVRFPSSVFKILKSEEILWRGGCRLARGEIDYALARQRSGGYKQIYGYLIAALRG